MELKTLTVGVKRSKNFQTYTVELSGTLGFKEDEVLASKELFAKCRKIADEQIRIDEGKGAKNE